MTPIERDKDYVVNEEELGHDVKVRATFAMTYVSEDGREHTRIIEDKDLFVAGLFVGVKATDPSAVQALVMGDTDMVDRCLTVIIAQALDGHPDEFAKALAETFDSPHRYALMKAMGDAQIMFATKLVMRKATALGSQILKPEDDAP